jgi:hemerythrin-like domain-containing protein
MTEHRLIERVIGLMQRELDRMGRDERPNHRLVTSAVNFLRAYAGRCHQGKEEDVLYRSLELKPLSAEHRSMLDQLKREHQEMRKGTRLLAEAHERLNRGNKRGLEDVKLHMKELVDYYPAHMQKEDMQFFAQSMEYFSPQEQDKLLQAFWNYDKPMIHQAYRELIDDLEYDMGNWQY